MTVDSIDGVLAALGLSLKNIIAGAVTSFVSLRFFDGDRQPDGTTRPLGWLQKWTTFLGGWALAAWGGPPLNAYLELKPGMEIGVVLVLGLFGMAVAAEVMKFIRDRGWESALRAWRGGQGGGQ
jgi:hypothetical protein